MIQRLYVRVTISNDTVEADFVQVWSFQLQHLVDASSVDLVTGLGDLLGSIIRAAEASLDDLFGVLVKQVKGWQVCTRGDLDQLREAIADLCLWQSAEEGEVKEGVDRCVVCAKAVFVVAVVHSHFDRD